MMPFENKKGEHFDSGLFKNEPRGNMLRFKSRGNAL